MGWTKQSILRCWILKVMSVSAEELSLFDSHNWFFQELIHVNAQCERSVLTTLLVGSSSNTILASFSLACLTFCHTVLIFWHPNDISISCHLVLWPRNLNTIFKGKMVQIWRLVKLSILTLNISIFGIVYFKWYISHIYKFCFTGTLTWLPARTMSVEWHWGFIIRFKARANTHSPKIKENELFKDQRPRKLPYWLPISNPAQLT